MYIDGAFDLFHAGHVEVKFSCILLLASFCFFFILGDSIHSFAVIHIKLIFNWTFLHAYGVFLQLNLSF